MSYPMKKRNSKLSGRLCEKKVTVQKAVGETEVVIETAVKLADLVNFFC